MFQGSLSHPEEGQRIFFRWNTPYKARKKVAICSWPIKTRRADFFKDWWAGFSDYKHFRKHVTNRCVGVLVPSVLVPQEMQPMTKFLWTDLWRLCTSPWVMVYDFLYVTLNARVPTNGTQNWHPHQPYSLKEVIWILAPKLTSHFLKPYQTIEWKRNERRIYNQWRVKTAVFFLSCSSSIEKSHCQVCLDSSQGNSPRC